MVTGDISVARGVMIFWSLAEFISRQSLLKLMSAIGREKYVPHPRGTEQALKDALEEYYPGRTHRVEPLYGGGAYEIVEISRGADSNTYTHLRKVSVDVNRRVTSTPYDFVELSAIVDRFNKHLGLVRGSALTSRLVDLVNDLGGTRIKPGVYWLPGGMLKEWRLVCDAVEACETNSSTKCCMYMVKHRLDADEVRAIRDGLMEEVSSRARAIQEAVCSGHLKEKGLETRASEARALRAKIREYEKILMLGLDSLANQVQIAEDSIMAAETLLAAGSPTVE